MCSQGVRITGCTLADLSKDSKGKEKKNALSKIPFYSNRNEENEKKKKPSIIILHSSLSV